MIKKLVSIIIPYYKKSEFIKETLDSAFNQSYKFKEIIIIYDDEKKEDLNYLKKITLKKKIKIIINKFNVGAAISRNRAIAQSRGEYIAFLDSDDIWHKDKLKLQINFMKKNNYQLSHTTYQIINKAGQVIGSRKAKKKLSFNELLFSCDIGLSSVVITKKILANLKFPTIKTKEDYILWLRLSKKSSFFGINQNLLKWRKLDDSLSSNIFQKISDGFRVYYYYMNFSLIKSLFFLYILSFNYIKKNIVKF
tara:strand:+ start:2776 stop:3528 length:753 start_codon:yes stop_codon:yes gene_type:complete